MSTKFIQTATLNSPFLKRSVKIIPCQRQMIPSMHQRGATIAQIAKLYKVNWRTIYIIINPDKQEENKECLKKRGGAMIYYNKTGMNISIHKYQKYKEELFKNVIK